MMSWQAREFPYSTNSLNLLRLVLAAVVLFAHSFYILGRGIGPQFQGENLGGWAVMAFFGLSGFLICRSRLRTTAGDYLFHRVARIYPAFIVALVVTAVIFGPLSLLLDGRGLAGYLGVPVTPFQFVWGNSGLTVSSYGIGDTLSTVPYPGVWIGSLWTLRYEFMCYLVMWVVGSSIFAKIRTGAIAAMYPLSVLLFVATLVAGEERVGADFAQFARLLPFFAAGALVYLVVDRYGIVAPLGLGAIALAVIMMVLVPALGGQLAAPLLVYGLLALSIVIRQPRWVARNDISYGFYIFAWPVQQLAVLMLGPSTPFVLYLVVCCAGTGLLAWASWVWVERPSMRIARGRRKVPSAT